MLFLLSSQISIWLNAFYPTDVFLCSAVCPFKHRFRLFTPHLWHSSIGIGAKSFGLLVWRRNLSSSTIGTPGALRQANLWSFMCLSKSCCFSWQNSFWNSKGWTASIFALRRKTIDLPYQKPHVFKGLKAKAYFLHFYGLEWETPSYPHQLWATDKSMKFKWKSFCSSLKGKLRQKMCKLPC